MDYTNTEAALRINTLGAEATRGSYEFEQTGFAYNKTKAGVMEKTPVGRLRCLRLPRKHECAVVTTLSSIFVNWAISEDSRTRKTVSARYWKNLSRKNRLIYHINKYVEDLYGNAEFSYEIID